MATPGRTLSRRNKELATVSERRTDGKAPVEYEYVLEVRALEQIAHFIRREKASPPGDFQFVSFTSPRLLDLKRFQKNGLLSSYIVIKKERREEVVEEFVDGETGVPPAGTGLND